MGASGQLQSKNDHLIDKLIKDPNYKIDGGKVYTKLTLNGQGISDDWREVGYQKPDGYVRFRYDDDFLFMQRVIYQNENGDLKSDMVINHKDLDRSNNSPDNLEQLCQHDNNKKKRKKYRKSVMSKIAKDRKSLERVIEGYLEVVAEDSFDEGYTVPIKDIASIVLDVAKKLEWKKHDLFSDGAHGNSKSQIYYIAQKEVDTKKALDHDKMSFLKLHVNSDEQSKTFSLKAEYESEGRNILPSISIKKLADEKDIRSMASNYLKSCEKKIDSSYARLITLK